jgi:Excalibur calcium-binding domain
VQIPNALANLIRQADSVQRGSAGFLKAQSASHFQEEFMFSLSRSVQNIPQVLRCALRYFRTTMLRISCIFIAVTGFVLTAAGVAAAPANKCVVNGKVTYQQSPCASDEIRQPSTIQELNAEEKRRRAAAVIASPAEVAPATPNVSSGFSCDGRKYCSQMKSCSEAKYFLASCPGVKMDGDKNGIPC